MAVVSRIATIDLFNGIASRKTWVATAATQDTAMGGSVVVTITKTAAGATPPADPDTFTLGYYTDDGTLIRSVTLDNAAASQTDTFFFTNTGLTGGTSRWDTVEIRLRVTKTTGGPTATYDVETDGAPNTPPTTFTTTQLDRGWIRGTTTGAQTLSNVTLGGAKSSPAAYTTPVAGDGGDSLFVRTTLGAASYVNRVLTIGITGPTAGALSGSTNSTVGPVFDATFAKVADNRFPAAVTSAMTTGTVPNATLTGLPCTVLTSMTTDSINVDPRITRRPLFQLDDDTYHATAPMTKNVAAHSRRTDQQGFLAHRALNARGEGVNGLTYDVTLTPSKPGSALLASGRTTVTQGTEVGWSSAFLPWSSSLPGGTWTKAVTYTAPSDITGAAYTTTEAGSSATYTLVAFNSSYGLVVTVNHPSEAAGHMRPGLVIAAIMHVTDRSTGIRIPGNLIVNPRVVIIRNQPNTATPGLNNQRQYLGSDTDLTAAAWVTWASTAAYVSWPMSQSSLDSTVFERVFTNTIGWSFRDTFWSCICEIEGVTYQGQGFSELTDSFNQHGANAFDPTGLFK